MSRKYYNENCINVFMGRGIFGDTVAGGFVLPFGSAGGGGGIILFL